MCKLGNILRYSHKYSFYFYFMLPYKCDLISFWWNITYFDLNFILFEAIISSIFQIKISDPILILTN